MIKAKAAANLNPIKFEWDKGFKVLIKFVPRDTIQKLVKSSEETTYNKKHQKTTDTDWLKYGKAFMREAIVGWEGLTYRILFDICGPLELDPGVKLDELIEFSEENLAGVLENYNVIFGNFVAKGVDLISELYAEQKKKEFENL